MPLHDLLLLFTASWACSGAPLGQRLTHRGSAPLGETTEKGLYVSYAPGSLAPSSQDASPRGRDGSVQYYVEQPRVKDHSFGVAPFIRAGIEV
jgi:hypothetical protein